MEEAKKVVNKSPLPISRSASPIGLPDITGKRIIHIMEDIVQTGNKGMRESMK